MSYDMIKAPFYHTTSFAYLIAKPIGSCHWIMWALKYVFWGP
jgi:hypothetical protein